MAKQAHLQAILSAVDRLSPTLAKIGVSTTRTKAVLESLNGVNFTALRGRMKMVSKSVLDVGSAGRNAAEKMLPLAGLGALSFAGLGVGFVGAARGAMAYSAGIQDASDITGVAFEKLQQLQGAFRLGGVEAEAANEAIVKFNKGIAEGAAGKDKSFAALMTRLRIPLRNAKGEIRSFTEVLPEFADAIEKNQNPAVRTRMLMEVFGKSGAKLTPVLKDGAAALLELMEAQKSMGKVLSEQAGGALDKLDENVEELGVQYRVLSGEILGVAAPAVLKLVTTLQTWLAANRQIIQQRLGDVIQRVAAAFTGWIESGGFERLTAGIGRAWTALSSFVDRMGGLGNVFAAFGVLLLAGPVASLVALGGALARLGLVLLPLAAQGVGLLLAPLSALFGALRAGQVVLFRMSLTLGQLAIAAAPFLLAAAAIAGAAYLIYRNWDTVGPLFASVWQRIQGAAMVAFNVLRFIFSWSPLGIVVNNWEAVTAWLGTFWQRLQGVAASGVALVQGLLEQWKPLDRIRAAWEPVLGFLGEVWDRIDRIVGPGLRMLGSAAGSVGKFFGDRFGAQADATAYGPRFGGPAPAVATLPPMAMPRLGDSPSNAALARLLAPVRAQVSAQDSLLARPAERLDSPGRSVVDTTPLMRAGAMQTSPRVQGELKVRFIDAPPGLRVDPGTTNTPGLGFNPDVGYRSMGGF